MALTKKQKELDEMKWFKSEEVGHDACGTFDFCAACDKSLENPCDHAYHKTYGLSKAKKAAQPAEKKPATRRTKKETAAKVPETPALTQTEPQPTAPKKPAAKKSAPKKPASKKSAPAKSAPARAEGKSTEKA